MDEWLKYVSLTYMKTAIFSLQGLPNEHNSRCFYGGGVRKILSFSKKEDFASYLVLYDSFFFCEELSVYLTAFQACLHGML